MAARLDIESLRALKAVADCGGVTRASDYLALSQSAVSHKLRRLEESIDCRLLNRRSGASLLTEEGDKLLTYAERILTLHDEALSALACRPHRGRIRLGITEDTTSRGLARVLARFTRVYPKVSVRCHVDQSLVLSSQLDDGKIDIAVMQIFESDVRATDIVLDSDKLLWVQAVDFNLADRRPLPLVAFDKKCFYRRWAIEEASKRQPALRIETVLECASITGVCNAVLAGLGIALINGRYFCTGMREIPDSLPRPPSVCYVVRCAGQPPPEVVVTLASVIEREF